MTGACVSHSKRIPILVGHLVRFEDYRRHSRLGWRPTRRGAERMTRRWHDEAWSAYESEIPSKEER
jgi:hypothetical protein